MLPEMGAIAFLIKLLRRARMTQKHIDYNMLKKIYFFKKNIKMLQLERISRFSTR